MTRPRHSEEFLRYRRTLRCPEGHRGTLRFVEGTGPVVTNLDLRTRLMLGNPLTPGEGPPTVPRLQQFAEDVVGSARISAFRRDSELHCVACAQRWPVFLRPIEVVRTEPAGRSMTPLGTETRRVVNNGSRLVRRTVVFEETWTERVEVEWRRSSVSEVRSSLRGSAGVPGATVSAGLQHHLRRTFEHRAGIVRETTRSAREEVVVEAAPFTTIEVTLHWEQVWQDYRCDVRLVDEDAVLSVPYRVALPPAPHVALRELPVAADRPRER